MYKCPTCHRYYDAAFAEDYAYACPYGQCYRHGQNHLKYSSIPPDESRAEKNRELPDKIYTAEERRKFREADLKAEVWGETRELTAWPRASECDTETELAPYPVP